MRPTRANLNRSGPSRPPERLTSTLALAALCLAGALAAPPAQAQEFVFHAEPAAAFLVDKPQSERFRPGFYGAVRPGVSIGPVFSAQWSYATMQVPATEAYTDDGSAHFLMAGFRLRPLATLGDPADQLDGLFLDFNAGYVRTGDEDRFGFDTGLGYNFQVAPWFALGPVVRYVQIVQRNDRPGIDPADAQAITAGLNLSFGPKHRADPTCPDAAACPDPVVQIQYVDRPVAAEPAEVCGDRDRDGTCDESDRCPTRYGPRSTLGCPVEPCGGEPLLVLVQFPFDSARLPPPVEGDPQTMDPVLDEVAAAIAQDPSCRVCIIGHASEEGDADYNLDLSEERADSVSEYLTARGLADRKMPSIGMGEACQLEPRTRLELNRRVSFIRLPEGGSCPTTCPE